MLYFVCYTFIIISAETVFDLSVRMFKHVQLSFVDKVESYMSINRTYTWYCYFFSIIVIILFYIYLQSVIVCLLYRKKTTFD